MSKRLHRSGKDKLVAGVCGGIAESIQVDPLLIRLAFIILIFTEVYAGLVLYGAAALIMPVQGPDQSEPVDAEAADPARESAGRNRNFLALALIGLGVVLLAYRLLLQLPFFTRFLSVLNFSLWPLALIFLGVLVLTKRN